MPFLRPEAGFVNHLAGHEIIERSRDFFQSRGHAVIYGDTDSLFVQLGPELNEAALGTEADRLAADINAWWAETISREHRLHSDLELRVDAKYLRFFMPTTWGTDRGSKKRYAGLKRARDGTTELIIRGLEAVRTDWTALAREAQRELLRRVLNDEPWHDWLLALRGQLLSGALDDQLVYRKRLRRDLAEYTSESPHVRAAKLAAESAADAESAATDVAYVMTRAGPQPVALRTAALDHSHYLERQLGPALDVVLRLVGTSFEHETGSQLSLFDSPRAR